MNNWSKEIYLVHCCRPPLSAKRFEAGRTCCITTNVTTPPLSVQMESGGTVLSTNWGDVGKRTVDVKPPDDVEYKKN